MWDNRFNDEARRTEAGEDPAKPRLWRGYFAGEGQSFRFSDASYPILMHWRTWRHRSQKTWRQRSGNSESLRTPLYTSNVGPVREARSIPVPSRSLRRRVHLSRPRAAGGLRHARPWTAQERSARLRRVAGGWIIAALAEFGRTARCVAEGWIRVWVVKPDASEAKDVAIGPASTLGQISSTAPNLQHFEGIVPRHPRLRRNVAGGSGDRCRPRRRRCRPDQTRTGPFEPVSPSPLKPVKKLGVYMVRRQHLLVHEHVDYPDMPLVLPGTAESENCCRWRCASSWKKPVWTAARQPAPDRDGRAGAPKHRLKMDC